MTHGKHTKNDNTPMTLYLKRWVIAKCTATITKWHWNLFVHLFITTVIIAICTAATTTTTTTTTIRAKHCSNDDDCYDYEQHIRHNSNNIQSESNATFWLGFLKVTTSSIVTGLNSCKIIVSVLNAYCCSQSNSWYST